MPKKISNAVAILNRRYGGNPEMQQMLQEEREQAQEVREAYQEGYRQGLEDACCALCACCAQASGCLKVTAPSFLAHTAHREAAFPVALWLHDCHDPQYPEVRKEIQPCRAAQIREWFYSCSLFPPAPEASGAEAGEPSA